MRAAAFPVVRSQGRDFFFVSHYVFVQNELDDSYIGFAYPDDVRSIENFGVSLDVVLKSGDRYVIVSNGPGVLNLYTLMVSESSARTRAF